MPVAWSADQQSESPNTTTAIQSEPSIAALSNLVNLKPAPDRSVASYWVTTSSRPPVAYTIGTVPYRILYI